MLRSAVRPTLALLLCLNALGCRPDCVASADIQVTLEPNSEVMVAVIATLRLQLSIDGGAPKLLDIPITAANPITHSPKTLLLRPDPAPRSHYNVALTVEALDALGGLVGFGSAGGDVSSDGCNRLEAALGPLISNGDGGLPDLAFPNVADLAVPPNADLSSMSVDDMACSATPDEDSDGRGDACDLCPADYDPTPVDTDGDGLPDACDPDPMMPTNKVLYFDPFNADSGHWSVSGNWTVMGSERVVTTNSQLPLISGNGTDTMPVNVRVQMFFHSPNFVVLHSTDDSDVGIALTNEPDSASTTQGVLCALHHRGANNNDTLDIDTIQNGGIVSTQSTSMPFYTDSGPPENQLVTYRMRLTQHGKTFTSEAVTTGVAAASVSTTLTVAPEAPQFIVLRATEVEAHFTSVIAESVNP